MFADGALQLLEFGLCGEELAGNRIVEQCLAGGLKLADFGGAQFDASVLLVVEFLTTLVDALIHQAGVIVIKEGFNLIEEAEIARVFDNLGAKFTGFDENGGVECGNGHAAAYA